MADRTTSRFPHRRNHDGSWDSICPDCYRTICSSEAEPDLVLGEQDHHCASHTVKVGIPDSPANLTATRGPAKDQELKAAPASSA